MISRLPALCHLLPFLNCISRQRTGKGNRLRKQQGTVISGGAQRETNRVYSGDGQTGLGLRQAHARYPENTV